MSTFDAKTYLMNGRRFSVFSKPRECHRTIVEIGPVALEWNRDSEAVCMSAFLSEYLPALSEPPTRSKETYRWEEPPFLSSGIGIRHEQPGNRLLTEVHGHGEYVTAWVDSDEEDNLSTANVKLGCRIGSVLCCLLQGVVLGWSLVQRGFWSHLGPGREDWPHDKIITNDHGFNCSIDDLFAILRLSDHRRICREDLLMYAASRFGPENEHDSWTIRDYYMAGYGRLLDPRQELESVAKELAQEGYLLTSQSDSTGCSCFTLNSKYCESICEQNAVAVHHWFRRFRDIGLRRGWFADHLTFERISEGVMAGTIFIVHGSDHRVRDHIDLFLTKELKLKTQVMAAEAHGGRTLPEKFEEIADDCDFAVFLLTADDHLEYVRDGSELWRARQNVILEAGYFWGALGRRNRVILLVDNRQAVEMPTDMQGLGWIPITDDLSETKLRLTKELQSAGLL